MLFYLLFFVVTLGSTLTINLLFSSIAYVEIVNLFILCFLAEFLLDAIVAIIVHKIPPKFMNPNKKIYRVYSYERKFYEKIGIKKWKNFVPEMGQLCNFKKDKIYDPSNKEYLYRFMVETCYAEVMHFVCCILSYFVLLFGINKGLLMITICLPIAIINSFTQLLPAIIQRYVRPRIAVLYKRQIRD